MHISYHKAFSRHLGRDMEYKRFGRSGRPMVMFPTSRGRFFQYEDTGTIAALSGPIEAGLIQIFTLDSVDDESFFARHLDHRGRIDRHEAYFRYVREEALPEIMAGISPGASGLNPLFAGCSMGGFHAANFVFRFPELTAGVISLSAVYSTRDFFGGDLHGSIYYNSPLDYLAGLDDRRILAALRSKRLYFCTGRGAWEERMVAETHALEEVLQAKHIPAWVDFWGSDVTHDWPWWHKQLVYFVDAWLTEDARSPLP